jgi:Zn-dependent metalloprotease
MTNNKQQTAVDSIIEFCQKQMDNDSSIHKGVYLSIIHKGAYLSIIKFCKEQAKEIEKEQIKDAYWNGSDSIRTKTEILNEAEDFYNETYGGNK